MQPEGLLCSVEAALLAVVGVLLFLILFGGFGLDSMTIRALKRSYTDVIAIV